MTEAYGTWASQWHAGCCSNHRIGLNTERSPGGGKFKECIIIFPNKTTQCYFESFCVWCSRCIINWLQSPIRQRSPWHWPPQPWGRSFLGCCHKVAPLMPDNSRENMQYICICHTLYIYIYTWMQNWYRHNTRKRNIIWFWRKNVHVQYLWHHNKAKGQTEQDHVDAVHPPQEDKVWGNRGAKMTWRNEYKDN